jgi:hypothetical protein
MPRQYPLAPRADLIWISFLTSRELACYKKFRRLTDQWIGLALQAAQLRLKKTT